MFYDHKNNWCNWPDTVNCGDRPVCDINNENCHEQDATTTDYETTTKQTQVTTDDGKSTHKPDQTCESLGPCSSNESGNLKPLGACKTCFCECANHAYVQLCCPSGLVFNPDLNLCDWPNHTPGC